MAKVKLYARLDRADSCGNVALFLTFYHKKQYQIALNESFPAVKIVGGELVPGKDALLQEVAKRVRAKLSFVEIEIEKAKTSAIVDVMAHVKKRLAEESGHAQPKPVAAPDYDFFELWEQWIKESRSRISAQTNEVLSPNTLKTYKSAKGMLEQFAKAGHKLDITKLGKEFYGDFSSFCLDNNKISPNTFGKYVAVIKVFMGWAEEALEEKGVEILAKYRNFKATKRYKGVQHLTSKELALFQNFKTDKKSLEEANDIFLMMCYTGASTVDRAKVTDINNISLVERKLVYKRGKTGNVCIVPFFDDRIMKPVDLFLKYYEKGRSFPSVSDQTLNLHLKTIQKLVAFRRFEVISKTGRKTFATVKHLEQGVPSHIVMKALGHTTEKAFLRYIGTDHNAVVSQFVDKAQFLKAG